MKDGEDTTDLWGRIQIEALEERTSGPGGSSGKGGWHMEAPVICPKHVANLLSTARGYFK